MQIDLSNRAALVTGASGELGRVMARVLASCGADVAIHYHSNQTSAQSLCEEVLASGRRAVIVQADITRREEVFAMRERITSTLGAPDIIVNNAVSQYEWKTVLDQPLEDYEGQFRSSVLHNVLMAQAFVPAMSRKNGVA